MLLAQDASLSAGMDCCQDDLLCVPLRSSSGSRSAGAGTSAMEEMATTRGTDMENRIGQLETNCFSERAARLDAQQHVAAQRHRLTRNRSTQEASSVMKVGRHEVVWTQLGKCDVPPCDAWNDWEPVKLTNAMQTSAASETPVTHEKSISGPEKNSNSMIHLLRMSSHTGMPFGHRAGDAVP